MCSLIVAVIFLLIGKRSYLSWLRVSHKAIGNTTKMRRSFLAER